MNNHTGFGRLIHHRNISHSDQPKSGIELAEMTVKYSKSFQKEPRLGSSTQPLFRFIADIARG
ncbi:MAG: hypothetical protein HGB19_10640 [Chlorobiales bacterium]|nr:hypothetical protein [Chlorobiales bacterium]